MENTRPGRQKGLDPLQVIGAFWIALGVIMVVAVYAPPTAIGKLTNLAPGAILLAIGLTALLKGRGKRVSGETEKERCLLSPLLGRMLPWKGLLGAGGCFLR
jgi:hypothetical protein